MNSEAAYLEYYPQDLETKLEFDTIKKDIEEWIIAEPGRKILHTEKISASRKEIQFRLDLSEDVLRIVRENDFLSNSIYFELSEVYTLIEKENFIPSQEQSYKLFKNILLSEKVFSFKKNNEDTYPYLNRFLDSCSFENTLLMYFDQVMEREEVFVKNTASTSLRDIRKSIVEKERQIQQKFDQLAKKARENNWLSDETESIRGGERVLVVKAAYKRKIEGVIMDDSGAGKSVFLLPADILKYRNQLFQLKEEEKKEINRILRQLILDISPFLHDIRTYQDILAYLDFYRSKALYAKKYNGVKPQIGTGRKMKIIQAYHPLLFFYYKKMKKSIVPLDLELSEENRIMVISGPNAGGKSVCLKTAALLQLMLQWGLLLPLNPDSSFCVFNKILIDIGDNQSIENELSTYSARLNIMKKYLEITDENSFFLFDEFGAGTDPQMGGLVAETVLQFLKDTHAFGIVTTHYANLKLFASQNRGLINAAMHFDLKNLKPAYTLNIGKPGSSYTLEIIEKTGFSKSYLDLLRKKIQKDFVYFDKLIVQLQKEKQELWKEKEELKKTSIETKTLKEKYKRLKINIEENKKEILMHARIRADQYLDGFNRKFENLIKELRESSPDTLIKKTSEIRKEIEKERKVRKIYKEKKEKEILIQSIAKPITTGDYVRLKGYSECGFVESIKNNKARVIFNHVHSEIEISKLEYVENKKNKLTARLSFVRPENAIKAFSPYLDVRGLRALEVISVLDKFLDEALLHKSFTLKVLHGKGDGILRGIIRENLKNYTFVDSYGDAHIKSGGDGITLIELRKS